MSRYDRPVVQNNNSTSSGVGFFGLLTIVFIVLKLTGYIAWSWFWVLSPLWIGFVFWIVIVAFILVIAALASTR